MSPHAVGSSSLSAAKLTKKYRAFLPQGAKIMNYVIKASGNDCELCGYKPQKRPPKPGYPEVSEEMRVMRVRLPEGMTGADVGIGKANFTVTGEVIEINVCYHSIDCRERCAKLKNDDGTPKYDPRLIKLLG